MLGSDAGPLDFQLHSALEGSKEGLYITMKDRPKSPIACAFKIQLKEY